MEAVKPKKKCKNSNCMNDDQCEGCEDELAKVVSAILGLAGKGAALVIKGMAAGSLGK